MRRLVVSRVSDARVRVAIVLEAKTLWTRLKGLLGRSVLAADEGLWIVPCNSIHMFFMKFPIDAVFLDRERRVVRIYPVIQPGRCTSLVSGAHSCLELAAGRAAEVGLRVGDVLEFKQAGSEAETL
jgi:uncharacterized membrane protein (UPF0127 family)